MNTMDSPATVTAQVNTTWTQIMFYGALVFLAIFAVVVQWWNTSEITSADAVLTVEILIAAWVPFVVEALVGFIRNHSLKGNIYRLILLSVIPAARMTRSTFHDEKVLWLPGLGWRSSSEELFKELEKRLALPMLWIALMILPIFAVELAFKKHIGEWPWMNVLLDVGTAAIWFAFAAEFLLMVSVAEKKVDYCRRNWLNLAIILLPLISFLRGFQVVRAFRVAQAGRMIRVYRMRSLMLRTYQGLIAINAIRRLMRYNPEKHLVKLEDKLAEKEEEIAVIKEEIQQTRLEIAEKRARKETTESGDAVT